MGCYQLCLFFAIFATSTLAVSSHKILLMPWSYSFNSHVLDFIRISEILREAGHETHFLLGSSSAGMLERTGSTIHTYDSGASHRADGEETFKQLYLQKSHMAELNVMILMKNINENNCRNLISDQDLLDRIGEEKFDLMIADVSEFCWSLVYHKLENITAASYSPVGYIANELFPNYLSFMPGILTAFDGNMDFFQRLQNLVDNTFLYYIGRLYMFPPISDLAHQYNTKLDHELTSKLVHFSRSGPGLDQPHPSMPHVVEIGGALLRPPSPLPRDLEEFVMGAGEAGVVVVSFGTLVSNVNDTKGQMMARVFSRLKQRVIWKYKGSLDIISTNIRVMSWLPQNDLLGHNQTRLFITHCGMSSTFEAAGNAVPVMTVPLFADQVQNSAKLVKYAKMGQTIDYHTVTEHEFEDKLNEVLENPVYKKNAAKAKTLMFDQAVHPKDNFVYYVDRLVRTKGATDLIQPRLLELNTFALNSIDTYAALIVIVLIILLVNLCIFYKSVKFLIKVTEYVIQMFIKDQHEHSD